MRIRVSCIHDLIIQVALIRPGPIQGGAVHPYIARCLGEEEVTYDHPSLEPVLEETKGVFVFQEQVIQAAMKVAGFSSLQADQLRRAMSRKRSREEMEKQRRDFMTGAANNGVDEDTAVTIYDKILAFASFGFPKSHAAAMAVTAFQVAWLKRYYPPEFYCSLLNEQPMGFYTPEVIANDARRHDIEIRPVDVNRSEVECTMEDDLELPSKGAVRLGYRYVKGLAQAAWERLRGRAGERTVPVAMGLLAPYSSEPGSDREPDPGRGVCLDRSARTLAALAARYVLSTAGRPDASGAASAETTPRLD